jgi:hypothetical protein
MSRLKLEERHGYYRRCQTFRRNGEQCKAPAIKGDSLCYKHAQEADLQQRRQEMRQRFALPPLRDLKTVQASIGEVANAIIDNRIDEDYAAELLQELERASIALRPTSASR